MLKLKIRFNKKKRERWRERDRNAVEFTNFEFIFLNERKKNGKRRMSKTLVLLKRYIVLKLLQSDFERATLFWFTLRLVKLESFVFSIRIKRIVRNFNRFMQNSFSMQCESLMKIIRNMIARISFIPMVTVTQFEYDECDGPWIITSKPYAFSIDKENYICIFI